MLILVDNEGKQIEAKKTKDMSTENTDYHIHRTKIGSIDGKRYQFHHYDYGSRFYFKFDKNKRWYQISYSSEKKLDFKLNGTVKEDF